MPRGRGKRKSRFQKKGEQRKGDPPREKATKVHKTRRDNHDASKYHLPSRKWLNKGDIPACGRTRQSAKKGDGARGGGTVKKRRWQKGRQLANDESNSGRRRRKTQGGTWGKERCKPPHSAHGRLTWEASSTKEDKTRRNIQKEGDHSKKISKKALKMGKEKTRHGPGPKVGYRGQRAKKKKTKPKKRPARGSTGEQSRPRQEEKV